MWADTVTTEFIVFHIQFRPFRVEIFWFDKNNLLSFIFPRNGIQCVEKKWLKTIRVLNMCGIECLFRISFPSALHTPLPHHTTNTVMIDDDDNIVFIYSFSFVSISVISELCHFASFQSFPLGATGFFSLRDNRLSHIAYLWIFAIISHIYNLVSWNWCVIQGNKITINHTKSEW